MILAIVTIFFGVVVLAFGFRYILELKSNGFWCVGQEVLTVAIALLIGVASLWVGITVPVKVKDIACTDAVKVIKVADQYYVTKDGTDIPVVRIKRMISENNKYELKSVSYSTILGADAGTNYTLIIPVKEEVLQED